jgi:LL-diaminopimelate aminotransferase
MDTGEQFAKKFFSLRIGEGAFGDGDRVRRSEKIRRARERALEKFPNRTLIDMGVEEPDGAAADATVNALACEARKYENRSGADGDCSELRNAVSRYMAEQFGISLSPPREIAHSRGAKAALALLPRCFIDPGDVVLETSPGHQIFGHHARLLMADVVGLPLLAKNDFFPNFSELGASILKRTKVVVLNYPNAVTGACAAKEKFSKLVEMAHANSFLIVNDASTSSLVFDRADRLSIFNVDGARDVAIEVHSMANGFNMSGWRIGWICGNEWLIRAYMRAREESDDGQFLAVQKAAAQTLNNLFAPVNNAEKYGERMERVVIILQNCGFEIKSAKAGFYLYTGIPSSIEYNGQRVDFSSAVGFAEWLIENLGIAVVPWDDAEASIGFSMAFAGKNIDEDEIIDLFRNRMANVRFKFCRIR